MTALHPLKSPSAHTRRDLAREQLQARVHAGRDTPPAPPQAENIFTYLYPTHAELKDECHALHLALMEHLTPTGYAAWLTETYPSLLQPGPLPWTLERLWWIYNNKLQDLQDEKLQTLSPATL